MKAVTTDAIIEGIRSKKDRSLGLTISTPELSTQEKAIFMELQGINVKLLIEPLDTPSVEYKVQKSDLNQKTPSQRMRNVLFVLWNQNREGIDFPIYYERKMDEMIEDLKGRIEE